MLQNFSEKLIENFPFPPFACPWQVFRLVKGATSRVSLRTKGI